MAGCNFAGLLSKVGVSLQFQVSHHCIANLPVHKREKILREDPLMQDKWDDEFGDRITELVLIGMDINYEEIGRGLDACLLTDEEMTVDYKKFNNPIPKFVAVS